MTGPKYLSVRENLRRRVSALPEHTLLPPEPVLCEEYGVSRITLRRAVDGLVADGHLVREQGRGTYVTRPAIRHEYRESFVHRIAGWSSVMTEQGAQVGTTVLTQRIVPAQPPVTTELGLEPATDVVELVRLRSVDGAPNHVAHSFLPAATYPRAAEADLSEGSLYEFLRREYSADLAHARTSAPPLRTRRICCAWSPARRCSSSGRRSATARATRSCTASPGCGPTSARSSSRSRSAAADRRTPCPPPLAGSRQAPSRGAPRACER